MTEREFFEKIMNDYVDDADMVEFCEKKIAAIDRKKEKAKERAAKRADELKDRVAACLTDEFKTIAEITAEINDPDVSTYKVTYRLNALVDSGEAEKDIEATETTKARTVKAYRLAQAD